MSHTLAFLQGLAGHGSDPAPSDKPSYSLAHAARKNSGAAKPATSSIPDASKGKDDDVNDDGPDDAVESFARKMSPAAAKIPGSILHMTDNDD